jgi:two-component system cell cycle sensor histidine kinase/response regulator CckA
VLTQSVLDALPLAAAVIDPNLCIPSANAAFAEWLGVTPPPGGVRPVVASVTPTADWERAVAAARSGAVATADVTAGGVTVRGRFSPLAGTPDVLVTLDPPALPAVVDAFTRFGQFAPFPMWLRDEASRYVYVNPEYQRSTRKPADTLIGRPVTDTWPADVAERFVADDKRVISARQVLDLHNTIDGPDGTPVTWHNVKFPLHAEDGRSYAAGIGIDVTDRQRAEDGRRAVERQLLHAQKMESLGVMAGGVAHDFNNLLTTILGNAGLARLHLPGGGAAADCLRKVEEAAGAAAGLCQQMLAYSGRGQFVVGRLHLTELVREMAPVLRSVVPVNAELVVEAGDPAPPVRGDATQMRQVILNLVTNAADAMADAAGRISVTTAALHAGRDLLDARPATRHLPAGLYAVLQVSDTGSGMDEGTRARIFDPFFSTKFTGRGLGLSAVQGIVRGHKGVVEVESSPGHGSTFRVLLPAVGSVADPAHGLSRGAGKTVLVIDDEDEVRAVARKLLEAVGFTVLTAVSGRDGVDTFRNFPDQVSAVLLDLTMPAPDGRATFRELRAIRADVPVVLWTGYGRQEVLASFGPDRPTAFLRKPFTAGELHAAVFDALGG